MTQTRSWRRHAAGAYNRGRSEEVWRVGRGAVIPARLFHTPHRILLRSQAHAMRQCRPPPGSTWSQGGSSSRQGPTQAVPSAATLTENFCAVLVNCRFAVRRDGISKLLQNTRQHTIRPTGSVDTHPRPRCCQLILNNHEECLEMQEQARLVESVAGGRGPVSHDALPPFLRATEWSEAVVGPFLGELSPHLQPCCKPPRPVTSMFLVVS